MDANRRRAGAGGVGVKSGGVVAGSVWDSRMKLDEFKGGIKVFNGGQENPVEENPVAEDGAASISSAAATPRKLVRKPQLPLAAVGKRKTWKSDGPIQIASGKTGDQQLSVSVDGIKKSPVQGRKGRSEVSVSDDGIDVVKSPIDKVKQLGRTEVKKVRSDDEGNGKEGDVSGDGSDDRSPIQKRKLRSDDVKKDQLLESGGGELRKVKSDSVDVAVDLDRNSGELRKAKSVPDKESVCGVEKSPPEIDDSVCIKEFGLCQVISSNLAIPKPPPNKADDAINDDDDEEFDEGEDEQEEEEEDEEIDGEIEIGVEVEKKTMDIKEISIPEEKERPKRVLETNVAEQKPKKVENNRTPEEKPKRVEIRVPEKKAHQFSNRIAPTSSTVNKQSPPVLRRATIYQNVTKSAPTANGYRQNFPESHSKLQNLVDLVMWKDISRSAFVFGIGTFIIISSSYTKELNVSFISVISYLGLVYLAAIFLYRSLICRGVVELDDDDSRRYVVGQDEAIWLLKLVLPYLNECLLKIRALFSGDPATTMKMAVLLFVFARCGSSITIWKMAKLGFFGVFIVPKVCSSYSTQLTGFGRFWIRRFRDAWDSCTHKKAVALGIFTVVWNLSSMAARIWAVFMMFVAVRYYQQTMDRDDWVGEEEEEEEGAVASDSTWHKTDGGHTTMNGPNCWGLFAMLASFYFLPQGWAMARYSPIYTEDQTETVLGMKEMVIPILAGILSALRRVIARRVSLKKQLKRRLNAITITSATCFLFPVAMWDFKRGSTSGSSIELPFSAWAFFSTILFAVYLDILH